MSRKMGGAVFVLVECLGVFGGVKGEIHFFFCLSGPLFFSFCDILVFFEFDPRDSALWAGALGTLRARSTCMACSEARVCVIMFTYFLFLASRTIEWPRDRDWRLPPLRHSNLLTTAWRLQL